MAENIYRECDYGINLIIASDNHGTMCFIIDKDELEKVQKYRWCIQRCKHKYKTYDKYYARATNGRNILLHRIIANADKGQVVDHINGNTFDNRKCNVRIAGYTLNNYNRVKTRRKTKESITGVRYTKESNKWHAYISKNKKQYSLGYFVTEEEAINARKEAENKLYGDV